MIVVVDYKTGNVGSLLNMLKKIGVSAVISQDASVVERATKLILPGIGAFDTGMKNLTGSGLLGIITEKVIEKKTPILGVCLGMQLFSEESEEGRLNGLNWIEGKVIKFNFQGGNLKVPHMGWNTIVPTRSDVLFQDMPNDSRFYFVHSYHMVCKNQDNILATTNYGYDFASIVRKDNIIGVQFHPEKSHKFGMKLLKNFIELC